MDAKVIDIPRSRPTNPAEPFPPWAFLRTLLVIGAIGALWFVVTDFHSRGAPLLISGIILGCAIILFEHIKFYRRRYLYQRDPGACIDDKGLTLFFGTQPTIKWEHMSHVSVRRLPERPAIIYGRAEDVGKWDGRESRMKEFDIDFLAVDPGTLVGMLQSHPCFKGHTMPETKIA